ncbi:MAG: tetratricopeptide repeat protein [gamma proteobacterium symbiont of Taylorina sp.]|nr:tetratricopeptide repeat protein [gamma proteobacterium symbiont of Taylorina sp.]
MIKEGYRVIEQEDNSFTFENLTPYLKNILVLFFTLFVFTLIVYFPSFSVPFYLDDYPSIVENTAIHDVTQLASIWGFYFPRFIGYLSFAFNYSLGGESTFGYHLVNFIIHFLAGIGVFLLTRILLQTLNTDRQETTNTLYLYTIPFLAALLFLIAPQQTQSVTYIVQRLSSMAAMFYIFALGSYSYARLTHKPWFFLFTALFAGLAFFTKQNTATLPAAILLIEVIFFQNLNRSQWKKLLLIAVPVLIAFALFVYRFFDLTLAQLDELTRSLQTASLTREQYFSTQVLVVWHYIIQFFIPTDLHLDYDYPVSQTIFSLKVISSLIAHIIVLAVAFLYRKQHSIIFFSVLFYYLAHLVESSIVPIPDLVFEHRTYLPNMGLSIMLAMLTYQLWQQKNLQKIVFIAMLAFIIWLAWFTFTRNTIWNNPIEFYQNETQHSPNKERVWADLGKYYLKEKKFNEALQSFAQALNLGRNGNEVNALPTTFLNTYFALLYTNQMKKALHFEGLIPVKQLSWHDRGVFYYMKGNRQVKMGQFDEAQKSLLAALKFLPNYLDAKANLAAIYLQRKQHNKARKLLLEVLSKNPKHKAALLYTQQLNKK